MPRENGYPPHLQRAIDEAEAKRAGRSVIASPETDKSAHPKSVRQRRGRMNKTEAEFALLLRFRQTSRDIMWFAFEPVRLRLADGAWYCPDFMAVLPSGASVFYEVKGFEREAAIVRLKVAAEIHHWASFILVKRQKGGGFIHTPIGKPSGEEAARA